MEKKAMSKGWNEGGGHPSFSKSFSFNGRSSGEAVDKLSDRKSKKSIPMRKPKSQTELLNRDKPALEWTACPNLEAPPVYRRVTAGVETGNKKSSGKILVNVNIEQSIGPLRVLLSADATVVEVIKAALAVYVKEGRRPILRCDPLSFSLHYSQFTIDCLNPDLKMKDLGCRNFFLCPKKVSVTSAVSCRTEMEKFSRMSEPWYKLMGYFFAPP